MQFNKLVVKQSEHHRRAASRRRVHGVARWARDLPSSSRAHLLVEVEITNPSNPVTHRDVQGSLAFKEAVAGRGMVARGATLRHAAAPFHAASLVVSDTGRYDEVRDETAGVLEEGFLQVVFCAF